MCFKNQSSIKQRKTTTQKCASKRILLLGKISCTSVSRDFLGNCVPFLERFYVCFWSVEMRRLLMSFKRQKKCYRAGTDAKTCKSLFGWHETGVIGRNANPLSRALVLLFLWPANFEHVPLCSRHLFMFHLIVMLHSTLSCFGDIYIVLLAHLIIFSLLACFKEY